MVQTVYALCNTISVVTFSKALFCHLTSLNPKYIRVVKRSSKQTHSRSFSKKQNKKLTPTDTLRQHLESLHAGVNASKKQRYILNQSVKGANVCRT